MKYRIITSLMLFLVMNTIMYSQTQIEDAENQGVDTIVWNQLVKDKYQIKYPNNWDVDESGQMGTSFILFSPTSRNSDNFQENINLLIQDLAGYDLTLDQYVEVSEKQVETLITDGKILSSDRLRNDNRDYQKMIYTGKQGYFNLKFEQYYWLVDEKAYVLSLTCSEDEFVLYQDVGESILNSFEFIK